MASEYRSATSESSNRPGGRIIAESRLLFDPSPGGRLLSALCPALCRDCSSASAGTGGDDLESARRFEYESGSAAGFSDSPGSAAGLSGSSGSTAGSAAAAISLKRA